MRASVSVVAACVLASQTACATAGRPVPSTSPQSVVEAKFAAVNRHDVAAVIAWYAPDAEVTAPDLCVPRLGREGVRRIYEGLFAFAPDITADVHETFAQGDRVVVRMTVRGSVQGRSFAVPIANFFTVRNGLIVRDEGFFDNGGRPCSP